MGGKERQTQRRNALYQVSMELSNNSGSGPARKPVDPTKTKEFFQAISSNTQAKFGVVKLCELDINSIRSANSGESLLEFASAMKRDAIVSSLIRAGAVPDCLKETEIYRKFLNFTSNSYSHFATYAVMMSFAFGTTNDDDDKGCTMCSGKESLLKLNPCHHIICQVCYWKSMVLDRLSFYDDLVCLCCNQFVYLEKFKSLYLKDESNNDWKLIAKKSFEKWKLLPEELEIVQTKYYRRKDPSFEALPMKAIAGRFLGGYKKKRNDIFLAACQNGFLERVKELLYQGCNINITNEYGQTGLYLAFWKSKSSVVELLLKAGADATIADNAGILPGHIPLSLDFLSISFQDPLDAPPPTVTRLYHDENHPASKAFYLDNYFSSLFLDYLDDIFKSLPMSLPEKESCSDRYYHCDVANVIGDQFANALQRAGLTKNVKKEHGTMNQMRFLAYQNQGGSVPAHVDLSRTNDVGIVSNYTFILYLTDCELGGCTNFLESLPSRKCLTSSVIASVQPKRGRLLIFPHLSPHEGAPTISVPKIFLRGEMYIPNLSI